MRVWQLREFVHLVKDSTSLILPLSGCVLETYACQEGIVRAVMSVLSTSCLAHSRLSYRVTSFVNALYILKKMYSPSALWGLRKRNATQSSWSDAGVKHTRLFSYGGQLWFTCQRISPIVVVFGTLAFILPTSWDSMGESVELWLDWSNDGPWDVSSFTSICLSRRTFEI